MQKLFALAGIAGFLTIAGCTPVPLTKADVNGRVICDEERMLKVENDARRNNRALVWVNCPQVVLRTT